MRTTTSVYENEKDTKHSWLTVKHVWWIDALLFILGTILLGGLSSLLGGKMGNFEGYTMPPATVPPIRSAAPIRRR